MICPADYVAEARAWVGVRWRHQGRTRQGVDCAGLVICLANKMGMSDFDTTDYDRIPDGETLQALCDQHMKAIKLSELRPADILLMRFDVHPQHMAIVTDYPGALGVIHAYANARKVVEHRLDDVWLSRVVRAYRFPEFC